MNTDKIIGMSNSFKAFWLMTHDKYIDICCYKDGNGAYLLRREDERDVIKPEGAKPILLLGRGIYLCKDEVPMGVYTARRHDREWHIFSPEGKELDLSFWDLQFLWS